MLGARPARNIGRGPMSTLVAALQAILSEVQALHQAIVESGDSEDRMIHNLKLIKGDARY